MHNALHIKKTKNAYILIYALLVAVLYSHSLFSQEKIKNTLLQEIKLKEQEVNFKQDTAYINLLHKVAKEYKEYNLDSLPIIADKTIKLSEAINYKKGIAKSNIIKGGYYSDIGEQDKAISYFLKGYKKATKIKDVSLILESKNELATEYMYKELYAKSIKEFLSGIEIAKKNNNTSWLSIYYINLSVVYSVQKEYDETIYFLKQAMEVNEDNQKLTGITLSNLAFTYIEIKDLKSASSNINEAISIFEELQLDSWLTYAYEIKGTIFIKQNEYNHALIWLKKSETIHEKIDQQRYKIPLYLLLAQTYYGLENYELANNYGVKALNISRSLKNLENREDILDILYKVKKSRGNFPEALAYLEDLKAISDTINKNNNSKELRILKSNLEFEQEKEKYILENNQKQLIQNSYIYFSIFVILSFGAIIFILKRNNRTQNTLNKRLIDNTLALEKNEVHLKDANDTKSKLFSIIAHDLKGPINSFKSLLDLFNQSELTNDEFIHFMPQIGKNIDSIAFTLNNLLTWGQTQMNGLSTKPDLINIKSLVDESVKLLNKQAEEKSITIESRISEHVVAWSDKDQIDIVIRNLISNAIKFTENDGKVTLSAVEQPSFWEIYIKDNGVGMDQNTLNNLFNSEETISTYGTQNEKGTGLGLRVCKEMIENNGGLLYVDSELNQGSTFYFTLPKTAKV